MKDPLETALDKFIDTILRIKSERDEALAVLRVIAEQDGEVTEPWAAEMARTAIIKIAGMKP